MIVRFHVFFYNKPPIGTLISTTDSDIYMKTEIDTLFSNIDLINYYIRNEVDDIDNELSTLILNTYTKTEIETNYFDKTSDCR